MLNTKEPQQGGRDLSHCADDGDEGNYRDIREEDQRNNLHTQNIDDPKLAVSVKKGRLEEKTGQYSDKFLPALGPTPPLATILTSTHPRAQN